MQATMHHGGMKSRVTTLFIIAALIAFVTPSAEAALSKTEQRIVRIVDEQLEEGFVLLERAVNIPSATTNLEGVKKVGALFRDELDALGFKTRWIDMPPELRRAGHLFGERDGNRGRRVLLIGHLDTVLEGEKFERDGEVIRGTGTSDMKGGNVVIIKALEALHRTGALDRTKIIVAFIGDEEEAGRPLEISRADLIEAGRRADVALAFEGAVGTTGTVARRGISSWRLEVSATQGHSSLIFTEEMGAGAIFEAARIINAFREELGGEQYLTFNPSVIAGGTNVEYDPVDNRGTAQGKTNVIPRKLVVEGDLRFISNEQREATRAKMRAIVERHLPSTTAEISFADGYPAMAPRAENYEILSVLDGVSRDLGDGPVEALDPGMRGAGDISFVGSLAASLDGLGASGGREHAPGEFVNVEPFPMLIKRAALLIYRLTR